MFQNTKTVETGLSDFHKMTVTVLKTAFKKSLPKIITYRDYKKFCAADFGNELYSALYSLDILKISNDTFSSVFMQILNEHCPLKQKYVGANESPFMTTELRKAIMVRSRLKNTWNKEKSHTAKLAYTKQRNFCTNLLRKARLYKTKELLYKPSS